MWRDRSKNQVSGVALGLFAVSVAADFGLMSALGNQAPLFTGLLIGLYLLFQIKIADQGPGLFHVIPSWIRLADTWIRESVWRA